MTAEPIVTVTREPLLLEQDVILAAVRHGDQLDVFCSPAHLSAEAAAGLARVLSGAVGALKAEG